MNVQRTTPVSLAIVTVTYSPGEHLPRFLDTVNEAVRVSTLSQPHPAVVLADNGSTDGVPEAESSRREGVHFFSTGGNIGYGAAMNAGVSYVRSELGEDPEFFLLSNPDVTFEPESLEALVECALRHPEAAAVGPRILEEDGSTYPSARTVPTLFTGTGHALLSEIWPGNPFSAAYRADDLMDEERLAGWLSGSCLLVRSHAFDAVGGFDERYFMYMEDVDLGDRFGRAGFTNVYCPDAIVYHAQGHSTKTRARTMLPAHHESAYRFQADRHPGVVWLPVRVTLRLGLKVRQVLSLLAHRRAEARR